MNRNILFIVGIIILILNLTACEQDSGTKMKEYFINTLGEGWEIQDCTIQVFENGEINIESGYFTIYKEFKLIDLEIYQTFNNNRNTIWNESYSIAKGVTINRDFKDIEIDDKIVDYDLPILVQITVITENSQEDIIDLEVFLHKQRDNEYD